MIHIFHGKINQYNGSFFLENDLFGIEISYLGYQKNGRFFLYPLMDERTKSIYYYCWDKIDQKRIFESIMKISGIGPKTAFHISNANEKELASAVESMNIGFFQKIPGVGPKTAKRLVVELKSVVKDEDLLKIQGDEKVIKDIIKYCKGLGYDGNLTKERLGAYDGVISKKTTSEVIKWLIGVL